MGLLRRDQVRQDLVAVVEDDGPALVEARVPFEAIERGERHGVHLVDLAGDRGAPSVDEGRERAQADELEGRLGATAPDEVVVVEQVVVGLAGPERALDEDPGARQGDHSSPPSAMASG